MIDTAPPRAARPPARQGAAILRFSAGALLALVFVEIVVHGYSFTPMETDPIFGPVLAAGATVRWAGEGHGVGRWTVHGIRRPAPPDFSAPSIAVLGDSYTEGKNVDDDEVLTHRLERLLRARGLPLAVLNFGRSYASSADYVARAPDYERLCHPRWTIVQLRDPDVTYDAWDRNKPFLAHFERDGAGGIRAVLPPAPPEGPLTRLLAPIRRRSSLYMYGVQRAGELALAAEDEPPLFHAGSAPHGRKVDHRGARQHAGCGAACGPTGDGAHERRGGYPVAETFDLLHRAYGGRITFLYLASFDPRRPTEPDSAIERALLALCTKRGWSCVDTREAHEGFAGRRVSPYGFSNTSYNFGHMNAAGHAAAAELLARELERIHRDGLL